MDPLQWAIDPWGKIVPIHIAWFLIWVAAIAGLLFVIVHAIFVRFFAKPRQFARDAGPVVAAQFPEHVPRHSLTARAFHWIMAASMFTLLFTAFLPRVGVQFDWVTYHWIAGAVLTASVVFHIFHASFFMDFWSIWPDKSISGTHGEEQSDLWGSPCHRRTGLQSILWKTSSTTPPSSPQVCLQS